jgi:hypothetical protein
VFNIQLECLTFKSHSKSTPKGDRRLLLLAPPQKHSKSYKAYK